MRPLRGAPLCASSSIGGGFRLVEGAVAQHGEQHRRSVVWQERRAPDCAACLAGPCECNSPLIPDLVETEICESLGERGACRDAERGKLAGHRIAPETVLCWPHGFQYCLTNLAHTSSGCILSMDMLRRRKSAAPSRSCLLALTSASRTASAARAGRLPLGHKNSRHNGRMSRAVTCIALSTVPWHSIAPFRIALQKTLSAAGPSGEYSTKRLKLRKSGPCGLERIGPGGPRGVGRLGGHRWRGEQVPTANVRTASRVRARHDCG